MRLTKKQDKKNYPYVYDSFEDYFEGEPINKLGKLEDVEEELGIDLITLSKILKRGIYVVENGIIRFANAKNDEVLITEKHMLVFLFRKYFYLDYGKTWALTKEELK